ncbi:MAG: glycine cleavage system aminomethyltransferase GcvT [Sulfolobaceae archaeon]|nr:glycine cleavage system aminomethyltransferase GcvT [Sulfolobaceae archaeon]
MFKSPLSSVEEKLNANFGEFAGWEMPMSYTSYMDEHMAVRSEAAFFDISHMGRLRIKGSIEELNKLIAKDLKSSQAGFMIGPTAFLNDKGGFIDDVMVYKISDNDWLIVTNAINREKDMKWITSNSSLEVQDLTFDYVMIAIQGRRVWDYLKQKPDLKPLQFVLNTSFLGEEVFLLSRSGWTGEDGLEVWAKPEIGERIVTKLVNLGLKPAGLICRDSIRQEMGFVLYGEDIDEKINPIEARYWVFSLNKDFIGKEAIIEALKNGVNKIRVGFKFTKGDRTLPRSSMPVMILDKPIGYITSSTFSPYLNRVIAMGYIETKYAYFGYSVEVNVRGKKVEGKIQDFPFIK